MTVRSLFLQLGEDILGADAVSVLLTGGIDVCKDYHISHGKHFCEVV